MGTLPQMKDMLKLKDNDGNSILMLAALSKNAVMFNAVMTFVAHHLSSQEVSGNQHSTRHAAWLVRERANDHLCGQ